MMNNTVYLAEDDGLLMRPLSLADSQLIVNWRNNPRVRAHYIYKKNFTLEGQQHYYHARVETGQVVQMIFCLRMDVEEAGHIAHITPDIHSAYPGERKEAGCPADAAEKYDVPIGCAVLDDVHPKYAECGNWIGEDWAVGHGYSPRMIRMICAYGFARLGLEDIVARIFVDNPASIRSYERAGFQTVGVLPDVESTDGTRQDMLFLRLSGNVNM